MKKLALLLLAAGLLNSCTNRLLDVTVLSTKNIDLNNLSGYTSNTNQRVTGRASAPIICVIPFGYPSAKEAADRAVERNGSQCVGLANATFTEKWWWIPFIYGQITLEVEGDPIMKKTAAAAGETASPCDEP